MYNNYEHSNDCAQTLHMEFDNQIIDDIMDFNITYYADEITYNMLCN